MTKKLKSEENKPARPTIQISRTRTSGKKRVDLFANIRNTEHPLDNIISPTSESAEMIIAESPVNNQHIQIGIPTQPSTTNTTGISSITGITGIPTQSSTTNTTGIPRTVVKKLKHVKSDTAEHQPVSPARDFTKTPNSVTRIILAQGLFRGKSKQIYDYLWSVSRGAIQPTRIFRRPYKDIQKGSGIGSKNTIIDGIKHLENIGLINKKATVGEAAGNEYEIFTPEELGYTGVPIPGLPDDLGIPNTTGITGITGYTQNLVIPVIPETGYTGVTQIEDNKSSYEDTKTSFKDFKTDDEGHAAFFELNGELSRACEKLTGKKPFARDAKKWKTLGELLVLELEIAARRAGPISNVPAFLTEVLRRKLMNPPTDMSKPKNKKIDVVGKNESGEFEVKSLDEKGRKAALAELQEFAEDDFLEDFRKWYTTGDWTWLMENLKLDADRI